MKNKKVIITIMVIITILLISTITAMILNIAQIGIFKTAKSTNITKENEEQTNSLQLQQISIEENNEQNSENTNTTKITKNNIQEARIASTDGNKAIQTIATRSEIERLNMNPVYVSLNEQKTQDDYEEIKTYVKLNEVKISFNMNVAQTTGLSKEDFIQLVQNMKYDRTGILKNNAGWIWECCQKYSVNEIFVLGICGIESGWCSAGQHQKTHNYSSLMSGGKLIPYATDEQGFEAMIKLLGQKYLSPKGSLYHGQTITGVGTSYCNATTWPGKVYKCMTQVFE